MVQHVSLPSAKVHEPKHITNATTSDAGKVITPSSSVAGVSVLRNLEISEINLLAARLKNVYGTRGIVANASTIAITAAVDSTLATNSDYVQVTGIYQSAANDFSNEVTIGTNSLTATVEGTYRLDLSGTYTFSVSNTTACFKFAVNNTTFSKRLGRSLVLTSGDTIHAGGFLYLNLLVGDSVSLYAAATNSGNLTIADATIDMVLVERA